jgi:hypothetical protein
MANQQMGAWIEQVESIVAQEIENLYRQAVDLGSSHMEFHMDGNAVRHDTRNKSIIFMKVRRRGNSVNLEWIYIKWGSNKKKGKKGYYMNNFTKQRGGVEYNMNLLIEKAQEWEKEKIKETETKARLIRKQLQLCVEITRKVKAISSKVMVMRKATQNT